MTRYGYDGLGRRLTVSRQNGTVITQTRYLWCGQTVCQSRDGNDAVTADYYGQGESHGAQSLYYVRDQLGSVVGVADASGKVLGTTRYGAYGVAVKARGMQPDYGYAGMLRDPGSSLYLTKYRAYDPRVGRWISRDPIGEVGGENIYAYVGGSPLSNSDLLGLESPRVACGGTNNSTSAWTGCSTTPPQCTNPCGCGAPRLPDFATFNINAYVFSVSASFSNDGNAFVGGAANFNFPNPVSLDASANVGWLNTPDAPSGDQIDAFLSGYTGGATAAYDGFGGGEIWSPGNGTATILGIGAGEAYQSSYSVNGGPSWGYSVQTGQTGIKW